MRYFLKPGLSFCHVADRILFLDLGKDRYFCLSADAERSFARLSSGQSLVHEDHMILRALADHGPVSIGMGAPLAPCPHISVPARSLLDAHASGTALSTHLRVGLRLASAPAQLRLLGILRTLRALERRKRRLASRLAITSRLGTVATAAADLRALFTTTDACLPRSIGVMHALLDARQTCTLVIGVKLLPFAAHAWVSSGDVLVNDRFDVVRNYTPILVI
ncbi:lasso peptide biosynthesis B2 protein [Sphingomonas immobilis]|uniref:Lasso peptide biosynthesis B2 protein n=1 Tax=Sphingomonas immobilis TaxID=3063997 RepID=A0ABT9A4D2_9SPHN|nr:lasso peptide biosynthesis B2 protein [Sphingomonas sp. CA1-15]MDO7843592.1 lasso peptide biosynthesis B2 protein [Sphingomonas sp. CA1-15]